ncbi:hypothetical protein FSW04_18930 [Baekduia soli]|uniref:Uncharacterized protein n=1 Tax=Baekduia soli TaxID=496014 RepID=A0A5B8U8W0_9ACTN|nr:hypothetical protein [Baekduia soli]QEC49440.1 hypothetical protein FSW04_18930 [Baekduia soli]
MIGRLHPDDIEAIADAVVARMRPSDRMTTLVDAATVAAVLGVDRNTVYRHGEALGGQRLGNGSRPRLRFDLDEAVRRWTARGLSERSEVPEAAPAPAVRRRERRQPAAGAHLLPIRGDAS